MGVLNPFVRTILPIEAGRMPSGCFAIHRDGGIVCSTLPLWFPVSGAEEIGRTVIEAFRLAIEMNSPLTDLAIHYSGLTITARDLRGGALIFLIPNATHFFKKPVLTAMNYKNLEDFILHLETHIECWKQFNSYVTLARDKKFTSEDDAQFLDLKSLITQGTEIIHARRQGRPAQGGRALALRQRALAPLPRGDERQHPGRREPVAPHLPPPAKPARPAQGPAKQAGRKALGRLEPLREKVARCDGWSVARSRWLLGFQKLGGHDRIGLQLGVWR